MQSDSESLKQRERESWSAAAPVWKREDEWLVTNTRPVSLRMVTAAGVSSGQRVLDVACGTGEPALSLARAVGSEGEVVATDFSPEMLGFARERAARENLPHVRFHLTDAETLEGVTGPFDAATIRWGIMFMPEPARCLQAARRLLKPGGRLVVATWGPPQKNPFIAAIMGVMRRHFELPTPPPDAPGIFAFADGQRLLRLMQETGFRESAVEAFDFAMSYRSSEHFYEIQTGVAAPIRDLLSKQTEEKRAAVRRDALAEAEKFQAAGAIRFPAMTWIATGVA
jgi:ubiquinone/menaquinone biosynthesis C-methylase UbiE